MKRKIRKNLKAVTNLQIIDIFYQLTNNILEDNILVINFGNKVGEILYSLHVSCFVRASQNNKILFTTSDEYFSKNYERLEDNVQLNFKDKLIYWTLKELRKRVKNIKIISISMNSVGDICIRLENNIRINLYLDCMCQNYEYYRLMNFQDNYQDIISFSNKMLLVESREIIIS